MYSGFNYGPVNTVSSFDNFFPCTYCTKRGGKNYYELAAFFLPFSE